MSTFLNLYQTCLACVRSIFHANSIRFLTSMIVIMYTYTRDQSCINSPPFFYLYKNRTLVNVWATFFFCADCRCLWCIISITNDLDEKTHQRHEENWIRRFMIRHFIIRPQLHISTDLFYILRGYDRFFKTRIFRESTVSSAASLHFSNLLNFFNSFFTWTRVGRWVGVRWINSHQLNWWRRFDDWTNTPRTNGGRFFDTSPNRI